MAATSSRSSPSSRRASLGAFGVGGFTAWVWLAVASTSAVAPVEAQYSPPPSPPPPPPSPPPPSPPPPSPPPPSPPPATGFTPTVRVLGTDTGLDSVGAVNTTNCCQWYKWCDNTNVTTQCTNQLLSDCDAVVAGGGTWNESCAACGMCRDSAGSAADMHKKAYLAIDHAYQACIDTRRTVQTQAQVADPTFTNRSVAKYTQIARDYTNDAAPDFVVCSTLNYKCLKQRSNAGCQVIPGVKIPGVKHSSTFGRSADASSKDPRRGPVDGRLNLGSGMMVYDADRDFDKVADMHDRGNSTHTGFDYPYGITKNDGDGLHASYAAQTKYSPTSDPVGRKRRALFALRGERR